MIKNIIIFVTMISLWTLFAFADFKEAYKIKLDNATKNLVTEIQKKYSNENQKNILIKLNKRLFVLKLKNKNNPEKYESLSYLQKNIMNELYKVSNNSKKTTIIPKNTKVIDKPVISTNPKVIIEKTPVVTKPITEVKTPVVTTPTTPIVDNNTCPSYYVHKDISASTFWVWEWADASNGYISNVQSAWDWRWYEHFKNWTENHFYIALPYNDFENWIRKKDVVNIPWYDKNIKPNESVVKNKWVRVEHNGKVAYGQWEDVWPFHEDDFSYVFWTSKPKNKTLLAAWIDLSPSLADYIWFKWSWKVNWNFVADNCVPKWDWTKIITKNNIFWE